MAKAREAENVYEAEGAEKARGAKNAVGIEPSTQASLPSTQASLPNAWPELSGGSWQVRLVWTQQAAGGRPERKIYRGVLSIVSNYLELSYIEDDSLHRCGSACCRSDTVAASETLETAETAKSLESAELADCREQKLLPEPTVQPGQAVQPGQTATWRIKLPLIAGERSHELSHNITGSSSSGHRIILQRRPHNAMEFVFDMAAPNQVLTVNTEYGSLELDYFTHQVDFSMDEKGGKLKVVYELADQAGSDVGTIFTCSIEYRLIFRSR